jgi:hypothetical protein
LEAEVVSETHDELPHRLRRHQVGPPVGLPEAGEIDTRGRATGF